VERRAIEAAKQDPAHFAELYEVNFGRVYGYIARRVQDRAAAEDLTADVFHHALANLARFEWRGAPFAAWLIKIASNAIIDRAKRLVKEREVVIPSDPETSGLGQRGERLEIGGGAAPPVDLDELRRRAHLFRLVETLPADQRRVIEMRFVEELSIREIAEAIGRTEGSVKQLQFRGLQRLRALMTSTTEARPSN